MSSYHQHNSSLVPATTIVSTKQSVLFLLLDNEGDEAKRSEESRVAMDELEIEATNLLRNTELSVCLRLTVVTD